MRMSFVAASAAGAAMVVVIVVAPRRKAIQGGRRRLDEGGFFFGSFLEGESVSGTFQFDLIRFDTLLFRLCYPLMQIIMLAGPRSIRAISAITHTLYFFS